MAQRQTLTQEEELHVAKALVRYAYAVGAFSPMNTGHVMEFLPPDLCINVIDYLVKITKGDCDKNFGIYRDGPPQGEISHI